MRRVAMELRRIARSVEAGGEGVPVALSMDIEVPRMAFDEAYGRVIRLKPDLINEVSGMRNMAVVNIVVDVKNKDLDKAFRELKDRFETVQKMLDKDETFPPVVPLEE